MSAYAEIFYSSIYSVLCADAGAHGESGGNVRGMGYLKRRDIVKWINFITDRDSEAKIVLYGVSMGGATVLFTSGEEDIPTNVRAVVSDSAYTNVYDEIANVMRGFVPFLPAFPIVDSGSVVREITSDYSGHAGSAWKNRELYWVHCGTSCRIVSDIKQ